MSLRSGPKLAAKAAAAPAAGTALFQHEARRDGRTIAVLRGERNGDGTVLVEATVTPLGRAADQAITRPFTFPQAETARRFADETLQALEYLGCDVVD